ncbi:MAG TPA: amidohydrolase family protein [Tepidisphaeraceae bacterium]|jgi:predicted TIM-barrel fold metal-dependent hydrolase|nr:amidohydrolase family protein [Tepidisphaeraceae bacterium]
MNFLPDYPIIDMHTHIWGDASGMKPAANSDELYDMADRFNCEAVVLLPLFGGHCPAPYQIERGNEAAAQYCKRDARFKPMVTVFPRHGQFAIDQLNRCMDAGFCGLKIWVSIGDEPCVFPLIERMIEYGKPTLIHAMHKSVGQLPLESDPTHIARLAKRYPEAKIILPHVGGNFYYTCDVIADCPKIYTDPSGSYCETGMVEHTVKMLGVDRVLFGSDAPGADMVNNLAKVLAADLSDADKRKILLENSRALWGWK